MVEGIKIRKVLQQSKFFWIFLKIFLSGTKLAQYWHDIGIALTVLICYNMYSGKVYHEQRKEIYETNKRTNTRNFENH